MATIERLLHVLLWAHPATTRKRYGDAIVQTILERVSHTDGKLVASALLLRECIGIVVSGASARRERARQVRKTAPRRRTPLFAGKAVDWFHDVRIASRSLWRRPWFSLPAILALALGVAAAVAIFSVFHAILLRPLPFASERSTRLDLGKEPGARMAQSPSRGRELSRLAHRGVDLCRHGGA